jgi:iron complex outermembrane recepter protein
MRSSTGGVNDGKEIPLTPTHQASAGLDFAVKEHFYFTLIGRYMGERFAINDVQNVTPPIKPNGVVDVKLSYQRDPVTLFLTLNNVLNELYYSYVSKSASSDVKNYYPAPERNFIAGMTLKF